MSELSQILAQQAEKFWSSAVSEHACKTGFPLMHSPPSRVGRLKGYGNAICAQQAQGFIEGVMEWTK